MLKDTGIVLKEALKMEPLKKCKLIAGFEGVNNVITRVNIMADPDIMNWVSEGDLLLTTAYFFKESDLEEQKKLIIESKGKKLAGLGIKVHPYLESLPSEILELANSLKFPIIDLYYEIPFTDIMTPIFQEIFNKQAALLYKVENVHNDLMNIILTGGEIRDIVKTLSKTIENPIIIKDHYFEEYIFCENECGKEFNYDAYVSNVKEFFKDNNKNLQIAKRITEKVMINNKMIEKLIVPIIIKNDVYGHIIVFGSERKISNFDILSVESASTIIALECLKRISLQDVESRYRAEFFEDLVSLDESRKHDAIDRAVYYKLDKNSLNNVIIISSNKLSDLKDEELDQYKNRLILQIQKMCDSKRMLYLTASKGNEIRVLLMWKNKDDASKLLEEFVNKIDSTLKNRMSYLDYKIGIGRLYNGLEETYKSLYDAQKAIEAGRTFIDDKIIYFDKLGIYKIFCQENLKDELNSFYSGTLMALVEYDNKKDTELVKTLEAYFSTNGNIKKMSEILFAHYNTILYRISRISEITKMDLNNEFDRFNLETALKIKKIMDC